jgi:glutamate dehydrogenase (NAD(P)+)
MRWNMCEVTHDELGPEKILELHSPKAGISALVVVDNTALGPSIGGVRVSPAVDKKELLRLARTMTLKNALAGLPHGGGKAGIIAEPNDPQKEVYFRVFAKQIRHLYEYIPGPDMGSNEESMAWIYDEIQRAVGLPAELGGIPLDKLGATGFGLAVCAESAAPYAGIDLTGARIAIQGFGSVGRAAARFLTEKGAVLVAVSDRGGTIYHPDGLDYRELISAKESFGTVTGHSKGTVKGLEELFIVSAEILIPAATPDVIHKGNADLIRSKLVLQGANISVTREAEEIMHKRGVLSIPDFIANAGGVIMASIEYMKKTEQDAFSAIKEKIKTNTELILDKSGREKKVPYDAASELARDRLLKAMKYRSY